MTEISNFNSMPFSSTTSLRSRIFKRYNRYQFALDLFGALSLALIVLYLLIPDGSRLSNTQDGMIANVLSEMVGIWISVRLIGFFIIQADRKERVRVRTVRLMRFFENQIKHVINTNFAKGTIDRLKSELVWANNMQENRERYLSHDEVVEVRYFYDLVKRFAESVESLSGKESPESITPSIEEIVNARTIAEKNILEETVEDHGM